MKKLFRTVVSALLLVGPTMAQEGRGFLNFVNLIPGAKTCEIRIDSKNPSGDGLESGDDTGWFLYPVGSASLTIAMEGLEEAKGSLQIKEGVGSLVAIYLEADPKPSKNDEPAPPLLRIKSFPTYQAEGLALRFVSLCPTDNRFQLGTQRLEVERFKINEIPGWSGASFQIKKNGKNVAKIPSMREKEPFYLLAGSDLEGNHTAALVYGGTVSVPPWRQKKKPSETGKNP